MPCAVFDLDGTLADTRVDLAAATNLMLKKLGLKEWSQEKVVSFVGNGAHKLILRALDGADVPLDQAYAIWCGCYELTLTDHTVLYPGIRECLTGLKKAGWHVAVQTNKPHRFISPLLKGLDAEHFFDEVLGGGGPFPLKPDPAGLLDILKNTGCRAGDSWMCGDNYTDLEAGRNAGMNTLYAAWGFGDPRDVKWTARAKNGWEALDRFLNQKN